MRSTLISEFRRIDPTSARIVLVDMASRVLANFSEDLSEAAKKRLKTLGAAAKLGIPPSTLESKIRSLKINKHQFKWDSSSNTL